MDAETEQAIEQYSLRYSGTYITTVSGNPVNVQDIAWDEDNEEIQFHVRKANNRHSIVGEQDLVFNVWPRHFTLYLPKWKGCVIIEKSNEVQIKRGVCDRSMRVVHDLRGENNLGGRSYWYDIVRAMQEPLFFDIDTAMQAMEEDNTIMSMPIGKNACVMQDGSVLYHGRIVGHISDIENSKWWRLINKEAA